MRDGWRTVRLGELFELTKARLGLHQVEPPVLSLSKYDGVILASEYFDRRIASASLDGYKVLPPGDWAYSTIHIDEGSIGRNNLAVPGVLSPMYTTMRWVSRGNDPRFFELILRSPSTLSAYRANAQGTVNRRRSLAFDAFSRIELDVPPLAEQRRIVDLIRALDGVAEASDRVTSAANGTISSLRQAAFSGEGTDVRLRDLCEPDGIQIGPFGSQLHARDYVTDGVPVVMPQDLVDGQISTESIARISAVDASRLARHRLQPGDILLPRRGDLTKRAIADERERGWICGTGSVRVRVSKAAPEVVFEALSTAETNGWLVDHAVGVTLPNLNTQIVGDIPLRIPVGAQATVCALQELRIVEECGNQLATRVRRARSALLWELLEGTHAIPPSYDRFLDGAA